VLDHDSHAWALAFDVIQIHKSTSGGMQSRLANPTKTADFRTRKAQRLALRLEMALLNVRNNEEGRQKTAEVDLIHNKIDPIRS
jgi:hypothetical protein